MRYLLHCIGCLLLSLPGFCQLGVGPSQSLFIQSGVTFTADSLVLIPGADITITGNALNHGFTPVSGTTPGTNSIARVYTWSSPLTYTGEIGLLYSDAELAGNTEAMLQIALQNGAWTTTTTSTVNTGTNYVSYLAAGATFNRVTATSAGITLPITYAGFSVAIKEQYVLLNWKMGEVDGLSGFEIEYSHDGRTWVSAATLTAPAGKLEFSFQHNDLNFTTRHYRIAGLEHNGARMYTRIVTVYNNHAGPGMRIVRSGKNALLYFQGTAPVTVQVYNMKGQIVIRRTVQQQQCEITGLIHGTYVISYITNGQKISRKIQL